MITDTLASIRIRLSDAIARRHRGLPVADDVLDLLVQVSKAFDIEASRIEKELDAVRAEEREACAVLADAERKACERHLEATTGAGKKRNTHQAGAHFAETIAKAIRRRGKS